jgi:hypothetical protein
MKPAKIDYTTRLVDELKRHAGGTLRAAELKQRTGVPKSMPRRLLDGIAGIVIIHDGDGPWFSWVGSLI